MKTCHMLLQTLDWRTWQRCWVRWTQQGIIFYLNLSCLHQRHFSQMRRLRALPCCTALKCELWDKEKRLWTWGFRMLSHLCDLYDQFCWNQYRNCDTHTDFFRDHIYLYQYQGAHPRTRLCILRGPKGETAPEGDDARNMKRIILRLIVKSGCALPTDDSWPWEGAVMYKQWRRKFTNFPTIYRNLSWALLLHCSGDYIPSICQMFEC